MRAVSSPHVDYIAIRHRRVNAIKADEQEGFERGYFRLGSGLAEAEQSEFRPEQPAGAKQGAACRIAIMGHPR